MVKERENVGDFEPTSKKFETCHKLGDDITDEEIILGINKAKCGNVASLEDGITIYIYIRP